MAFWSGVGIVLVSWIEQGLHEHRAAFFRWQTWFWLGWSDFWIAHRRTVLGPLWQIVQVGVWVVGLSIVFRQALAASYDEYLAYVAAGLIFWNFMSNSLAIGIQTFRQSAELIRNVSNPILIYPLRLLINNLSKLAFQFIVFFLVLPWTSVSFRPETLLVVPGLLLLMITAVWATSLSALIGVRFRDAQFALQSIMRFLFFATPVFWLPSGLGEREYFATLNPFSHYLEVVRAPLLGQAPSLTAWITVITITIVGAIITITLIGRFRREIVFWL